MLSMTCDIFFLVSYTGRLSCQNYQWLDFGNSVQILTASALNIMTERDIHFLRLFTDDGGQDVNRNCGLSNINRNFATRHTLVLYWVKSSTVETEIRHGLSTKS